MLAGSICKSSHNHLIRGKGGPEDMEINTMTLECRPPHNLSSFSLILENLSQKLQATIKGERRMGKINEKLL